MKYKFLIALLFVLPCCNTKGKVEESKVSANNTDSVAVDSSKYLLLKYNLYKDQFGNIAFKTIDKSDSRNPVELFITTVWNANTNDSGNNGKMEMKDVIDTASFKEVKGIYYQDKNHFYVYNQMSDGGTFAVIRDIDAKTYTVLNGYYAKDKNHAYYGSVIIKDADVRTFEPLQKVNEGDSTWQYAKDKNHFYYFGDIIKPEELKLHNLKK